MLLRRALSIHFAIHKILRRARRAYFHIIYVHIDISDFRNLQNIFIIYIFIKYP